jgi:uncharacterized protein (TIGR03435 family)
MMSSGTTPSPTFATLAAVCLTIALTTCVQAQSSAPGAARFEVATVKPTIPDNPGGYALNCSNGAGFVAKEQTLLSLIEWAYDLPHGTNRVLGGPNWMSSTESRFEVHGKVERPVSFEECRLMVQSLLGDRFRIMLHWETRELPVYTMTVGKKGPKLHRAGEDPKVLSSVTLNGAPIQIGDGYRTTASGRGMSMEELARLLTRLPAVGRTVIDKTGIDGFYGFSLDYALTFGDENHPDIFAALQQQLGLRLESTKAPVEIILVDHAERPTGN